MQAIRAIAFMGVFLNHAIKTFPGEGRLYNFFARSLGPWGVSVFFVLSGFVMTYSYWNRPPQKSFKDSVLFSFKKIRKFYPLHLLMLLVGAVYLLLHNKAAIVILKRLAITIPLIQTWLPVGYQAINSVAWYLSACVFLYFCFPILLERIKGCEKKSMPWVVVSSIFLVQLLIGYCVFRYTNIELLWITYCHPVFRLGDFAVGGFLASVYIDRRNLQSSKKPISKFCGSALEIVSLALNVAVCIFYANSSSNTAWFRYTSLFLLPTVLLIYAFSLNSGIVSDLLTNKFTFWLAAISPYAFLIHRLVIHYFHDFMKYIVHCEDINFMIVVLIPWVGTVIAVYVYQKLEKAVFSIANKRMSK